MKKIKLTQGKYALVDNEDFEELNKHKWYFQRKKHMETSPAARSKHGGGTVVKIYMHRQITNAPDGMCVDHIDGNGTNNQKSNLRICTWSQNQMNVGPRKGNRSGYRGVAWHKSMKKWQVRVRVGGKEVHFGYFTDKDEAGRVYDLHARKHHGEFAKLNFSNK